MKRVVFGNRNVFISLGYIPRSRNCRKSGDCLTTTLFSKVTVPFYISISSIEGFSFSTPSSVLVDCLFYSSHPDWLLPSHLGAGVQRERANRGWSPPLAAGADSAGRGFPRRPGAGAAPPPGLPQ